MSFLEESFIYETNTPQYNDHNTDDPNDSDNIPIEEEEDNLFSCSVCFKEFPNLITQQRHYVVHIANKPYPCKECEKSFFTESALKKHNELHQDGKFYQCELCESVLLGKSAYKAHVDAHYFPDFTCNACFQNFPTKQLLQQHEKSHTSAQGDGILSYSCMLCDYYFVLQRDLEDHMEKHEKVCLHTCKKCDKEFFYSYMLQKHLLKHQFQVVCNVCSETFNDKGRLHEHEQLHLAVQLDQNNILRFACELCSIMFPLKVDLETHYNDCHEGSSRFPCTMCFESFFFSYMLRKHKIMHMEFRDFNCELCPKIFKTKGQLNMHMKHMHEEKEIKCLQCGKAFSTKRQLHMHSITHTSLKPFQCSFCGLAFKLKQHLERHYSTHTDTKRYKCKQCDTSFTRTTGLKHHMKLHNRNPIICKVCGKTYMSQTAYGRHRLREHLGLPKSSPMVYSCEVCSKVIRHYSTYRVHLRQHTGEKPFKCKYCSRTFVQRPHLIGHHKFHHRDMELVIELPFKCAYCKHSCLLEAGLQKHHSRFHRSLEFKP